MKRVIVTLAMACCMSHFALAGSTDLLQSRADRAVSMMSKGLTSMTAKLVDPPTPPEPPLPPYPATSSLGNCNLSTSSTGDCASVVASSPNCSTAAPTNCQPLTSTQQCQNATYPARCGTQAPNEITCSDASCRLRTFEVNGVCVTSADCVYTNAAGCDAWTHRRNTCRTDTPYCVAATLATGCRTSAVGQDGCTSNDSYTISCITTQGGGSDCTSQGACLNTYGKNCISAATGNTGMCGAISAASGPRCHRPETDEDSDPEIPEDPGNGLLLLGGTAALAVLGRRFGLTL